MVNRNPLARIAFSDKASNSDMLALLLALQDSQFVSQAIALAKQHSFDKRVEELGEQQAADQVRVRFSSDDYPDLLFFGVADKEDIAYALGDDVYAEFVSQELIRELQRLVRKGDETVYATQSLLEEAVSALWNDDDRKWMIKEAYRKSEQKALEP